MGRLHTEVTEKNYPFIFQGCLDIKHDNGAINREEEAPTYVMLSLSPDVLQAAEMQLKALRQELRETFFIGEHGDRDEVAKRHLSLQVLSNALDDWFEDGMP